jgi:putative flippase GtrA
MIEQKRMGPAPHVTTTTLASPVLQQFLRFAVIGLFGTGAHYSVLILLVELLHVPVVAATTAGFVTGALVNYALNRRYTFSTQSSHASALPKFLTVAALGAAINAGIVAWLLDHTHVHYIAVQVCATALVLIWNFAANALWTFRK